MQVTDRIGRRIKLHDLNILMTVVQTGSMLKAAERLNTVQPAISRSIAELEHVLGVRLLDRHRKGVAPTEYGRALLDCGATVFDALRQGVKSIEFLSDAEAGEVRVGAIAPLALGFVTAVIDRVSRRYRRIVVHLVTDNRNVLNHALSERDVDFLIARSSALLQTTGGISRLSLMILMSWRRACKVPGLDVARSHFPIWSMSCGRSRAWTARPGRPPWKPFARAGSITPARQSSPVFPM